jgi:hypothetical protein
LGFTLETISERCRRFLHRTRSTHVTTGGANHSRREIAALGGGDPDGGEIDRWGSNPRARMFRVGSSMVNCYAVEDGRRLTIIDAGLPKHA